MNYTIEIAQTTKDPQILTDILKKENDYYVSYYAAKRENNDSVSLFAAMNPNCPIEAKINWMIKTGQIEKEDPNKHIIEYENNKEDDFQDLKDLL